MSDISLEHMNFLGGLSAKEQKAVWDKAQKVLLTTAGALLFSQNDKADAFYIVFSGTMGVFVEQEETKKKTDSTHQQR